jgi:hypothetical protein
MLDAPHTLGDKMNWTRFGVCGVVMGFASLSTATATMSECISVQVDARTLLHDSALVFTATLLEGTRYRLTFQPDRVWKGKPSNRATIYVLEGLGIDSPVFRPGEPYLIAARRPDEDERRSNMIDDPADEVFVIDRPCGSTLPLTLVPELDKLARPRTPR